MTLDQLNAKIREIENRNTELATRKQMYKDTLKKEFNVETSDELRKILAQVEKERDAAKAQFEAGMKEVEEMLKEMGVAV